MTAVSAARLQQRDRALAKANDVRQGRKHVKDELKTRKQSIEAVLLDPPATVSTMAIGDLLMSTPRYGPVRVRKLLSRVSVSPTKAVAALTERQRGLIVEELRRL